ncbi:MAG: class IV adenylate cyclase [Patescibacteria group bacterium]
MSKENVECEAKFRVIELSSVERRLVDANFSFNREEDQRDTYFKHPTRAGLSSFPTYLRVRTYGARSSIAMHHKLANFKWAEDETSVTDGDVVRRIYENLGFDIDVEVHKLRRYFKRGEMEVVLDDVKGLGTFIEIEGPSVDAVFECAASLGFLRADAEALEGKSYADLVRGAIVG